MPIVTFCTIIGASVAVIAYGRGYRIDLNNPSIKPTGLISATSDPIGAEVFVDDQLKTATNNSFNIDPGWYTVRITKDGYIPWQKDLRVQGEVVTRADAYLFPTNPSLSPLTTTGVLSPTLSPDGTRIAYIIPESAKNGSTEKAGLWTLELGDKPLGRNRDPQNIGLDSATFSFDAATITWSPDSTELMAATPHEVRLYSLSRPGTYDDITGAQDAILSEWQSDHRTKELQKLAAFPPEIINVATSSAKLIAFSQDETKMLYEATASTTIPQAITPPLIGTNSTPEQRTVSPGKYYVYDVKEDKNYFIMDASELPHTTPTPPPKASKQINTPESSPIPAVTGMPSFPLEWFPTDRHLIVIYPNKIDVMEYDRTNWITVYAGPFLGGFVAPWTNASRLVILTNLNPGADNLPNLYTVNLR